jgi:aspartyl-tRNA(Asn)/glutamyl-tRNA(Gln) amidotransferase subunit C
MSKNPVDENTVEKIASLAKLSLSGDELNQLTADFNRILNFVDEIKEAQTTGSDQLDHVYGVENALRVDRPTAELSAKTVQEIAPESEAGYIVVPKVIDISG